MSASPAPAAPETMSALTVDTVPDACERCEAPHDRTPGGRTMLILCIIHGWVCPDCWSSERHAECFVD